MLSKARLKSLESLFPPLGYTGVVNVALLLCGARSAFIYDGYNLEPALNKAFDSADDETADRILLEHGLEVATAVTTAFKNLKSIDGPEPMIYDPRKADEADIATVVASKSGRKKSRARAMEVVRAKGRLLGYAGTAIPASAYPDSVAVRVMAVDSKNRHHIVFSYAALPSEIYGAMCSFNDFVDKARPIIGKRLTKDLVVTDFVLWFDQCPMEVKKKTAASHLFVYERR